MNTHKSVLTLLLLTLSAATLSAGDITIRPTTIADLKGTLPELVLTRISPAQFDYIPRETELTILETLRTTYQPPINH